MLKLIALLVLASFASFKAHACSISVNALIVKNLMATAAANEFGIALDKVTKITFSSYGWAGIGVEPETECPLKIRSKAKVEIKYRPSATQSCQLAVNVVRLEDLSGTTADTYTFALPSSSCSFTPVLRYP